MQEPPDGATAGMPLHVGVPVMEAPQ